MSAEKKIISYLERYGNTRESDLVNYGVENFGKSPETVKKAIDRLAIEGKVHRIVHNKLKPPEVYVTVEEPLPPEATLERQITNREVEKILGEASTLAERIKGDRQP